MRTTAITRVSNPLTALARIIALAAVLALPVPAFAQASPGKPSGEEILRAMDSNSRVKSSSYEAAMTITNGKKRLVKTMKGLSSGEKGVMEFTNAEDRGVKYLKISDELWIYFPEEDDTVRVAGAQLKDGLMGSDLSYEDAMDADEMANKYETSVDGEEAVGGRDCWILGLVAKVKGVPYDKRKLWVDKERFVSMKEEMYSKSGTLLKTLAVIKVERVQGKWFATAFEMRDMRKKNSLTVFEIRSMRIDLSVDEGTFSLKALRK